MFGEPALPMCVPMIVPETALEHPKYLTDSERAEMCALAARPLLGLIARK